MANRAAQFRAEYPEAVSRRGRRFIEFDLPGGQKRFVATVEPLHYGPGEDQEIETAWIPSASGVWQHKMDTADFEVRIKDDFSAAQIVELKATTGETIQLRPQNLEWTNDLDQLELISIPQAVSASLTDDIATWVGAFGAGRDFSYRNHPRRVFKELKIASLASLPVPSQFILDGGNPVLRLTFDFVSTGLDSYVNGALWGTSGPNSQPTIATTPIEWRRPDNSFVSQFLLPVARDSGDPDISPSINPVLMVRRQGNTRFLEVRVPWTWLQTATYPVFIDPTYDSGQGDEKDNYIRSSPSGDNKGTDVTLVLGIVTSRAALIEFDVSSVDASATASSATLSLWSQVSNTTITYSAYSLASGVSTWTELGSTWDDYKASTAWPGSAGAQTSGTDYEADTSPPTGAFPNSSIDTEYTYDLSTGNNLNLTRVEGWFGVTNTNYGIKLGHGSSARAHHSSDATTAGFRPKLVIVYSTGANPKGPFGHPFHGFSGGPVA